jgi:hypothetical protein
LELVATKSKTRRPPRSKVFSLQHLMLFKDAASFEH